jgi:hypothetical protein
LSIREYTSKVDELIKDRVEAEYEKKVKEKERKNIIAQQVLFFLDFSILFINKSQILSFISLFNQPHKYFQ